ncbi:MAG: hypothetical protein JW827_00420, partial [Spirochaetes bacterium]|nr:hypothetical protein [Spirochaetota bacterium]
MKRNIIIFLFTFILTLVTGLKAQEDTINLNVYILGYVSSNVKFTPMSKPAEKTMKSYYNNYFTVKGMNYIDYSAEGYWTTDSHVSVDRLYDDNVRDVAINVIVYQNTKNSTSIYKDANFTPQDAPVVDIINYAHSKGMRVFLKVMVNSKDGAPRTTFTPSNTDTWFASYKSIMTQYARMARTNNIEMFSVGCELKTLSGNSYLSKWTDIISAINNIYSTGDLIYCANWDEYDDVPFWNQLDYIGIDAYFPLESSADPTYTQISNAWRSYSGTYGTHNWVDEVDTFRASQGKEVIFTEIGYRSADYAAKEPWKEGTEINLNLQVRCYEAAMKVWEPFSWFKGLYLWDWSTRLIGIVGDNHHFEYDHIGWTHETYYENQGCTNVARSMDQAHAGNYSLQMDYHLVWNDPHYASGMAYWDLGEENLRGQTISAWFYCPTGSAGTAANKNGVTIFCKDSSWGW